MNKLKIAVACTALLGAGVANAGLIPWPYQVTSFEDTAVDFFTTDLNSDGKLDVGDVLTAVVEIERLENAEGAGQKFPQVDYGAELTGLSVIQVVSKGAFIPGVGYPIVFGPAAASLWPTGTHPGYDGAINALWEDASMDLDLTACADLNDCVAKATNGTLFQVDGMPDVGQVGYDADNQWSFVGPDDITAAQTIDASVTLGSANFALSNLYNLPVTVIDEGIDLNGAGCGLLFVCAGNGKVDLVGSTEVKGGKDLFPTGGVARGNFAFQKVPAPAPVALIAVGLLGLAGRRFFGKK
jgi:hypothetical protein